ncbi:PIG-L deacetylase family protein [Phormidesmis priestleyi]
MSIKRLLRSFPISPDKLKEIHSNFLVSSIINSTSQLMTIDGRSAMVFSPHQDDETLGCGGMIALKRQCKGSVSVVFLTDGQGGVADLSLSGEQRVQLRKQEAIAALTILGVEKSDVHFLDKPDGTLTHLSEPQRQQTIDHLIQLLRDYQPQEIYVPHRRDRHPDHEATYELVQAAMIQLGLQATVRQYPIWILWKAPLLIDLQVKELVGSKRLSIQSVAEQKRAAIAVYKSQYQALPAGFLKRFMAADEFFW